MDDADLANERSAELLTDAIQAAQRRANAQRPPATHCENCGEALPRGVIVLQGRFCGVECRDDWEQREARR